jgi:hypothetical protein
MNFQIDSSHQDAVQSFVWPKNIDSSTPLIVTPNQLDKLVSDISNDIFLVYNSKQYCSDIAKSPLSFSEACYFSVQKLPNTSSIMDRIKNASDSEKNILFSVFQSIWNKANSFGIEQEELKVATLLFGISYVHLTQLEIEHKQMSEELVTIRSENSK